jgi:hypothetical protein
MAVTFSKEVFSELCARLAQGTSLRTVCKAGDMPALATFYQWLGGEDGAELAEQYARAKQESADADLERLEEISDSVLAGDVGPQEARVAADIIKWSMGKKRPRKYGDKIHTEHSGSVDLSGMSDEELKARLLEAQAKVVQSEEE